MVFAFTNSAFVLSGGQLGLLLPESVSQGFESFKTPNKLLNSFTYSDLYWLTPAMVTFLHTYDTLSKQGNDMATKRVSASVSIYPVCGCLYPLPQSSPGPEPPQQHPFPVMPRSAPLPPCSLDTISLFSNSIALSFWKCCINKAPQHVNFLIGIFWVT